MITSIRQVAQALESPNDLTYARLLIAENPHHIERLTRLHSICSKLPNRDVTPQHVALTHRFLRHLDIALNRITSAVLSNGAHARESTKEGLHTHTIPQLEALLHTVSRKGIPGMICLIDPSPQSH